MPEMSLWECRAERFPHNHRRRTTSGFYCEDCGHFFPKDSEDYVRTELVDSMYFSCWNIQADFIRKGAEVPTSLPLMLNRLEKYEKYEEMTPFSIPISEVEKLISDAKAVINEHTEYSEGLHSIVIGE